MIRRNQHILTQLYAICDFIMIQCFFVIAWWFKFQSPWFSDSMKHLPFHRYLYWSLIYGGIAVFIGYFTSFYQPKRKKTFASDVWKITQLHAISFLILLSMLFIDKDLHISRGFLAIFLVINICGISLYRYIIKHSLRKLREKGFNRQFVLILGAGSLGRRFYENLLHHPELGFETFGFLDDYQTKHDFQYAHYKPILGKVSELPEVLNTHPIDEVIIALPLDAYSKFGEIIGQCEKAGVRSMIIPDFFDVLPSKPHIDDFAGIPLINVRDIPLDNLANRIVKRAFDITFSFLALIATSPLLLLIVVGVKLTSPGPVIFKQERVGFNRRTFPMYKFRTMKVSDERVADTGWTVVNDPRRTAFGTFLRKTSLDELPQFFNVLVGHMSVVGPRPERPHFVEQFKEEIPKYMVKHHVRPGITGWAQSNGLRGDTSIEDRISYDIFYLENWTFLFDLRIIFKTVRKGPLDKNAY
ncbi:undecaprenyl-phosphate glucose phosphotransferase [Gorillibacterium massiliense]|uniref:undecaprenyl-phosphate glucose phosphotransferase n=1 Tax=Gorillibacterium massiliense TaxID=1280390 RepID=UPI0004B86954|nr:undecaprenyl-phosphate glucose phosphotransferase [Gorillibacterium massiliense]